MTICSLLTSSIFFIIQIFALADQELPSELELNKVYHVHIESYDPDILRYAIYRPKELPPANS